MADYRRPCHDERLAPCPICGGEPWADSKNGTIYCDCGLRYHMNGECHPEWHRMDWTADEWNHLANVRAENEKLRELVRDYANAPCQCYHNGVACKYLDGGACTLYDRAIALGVEVD